MKIALLTALISVVPGFSVLSQERKLTLPDGSLSKAEPKPAAVEIPSLEADLQKHLESFFLLLQEGKVEDAYKKLLEKSRIGRETSITGEFISKTRDILKVHGPVVDLELMKVKQIGRHLREITYQLSCREHPTQWRLFAYHNGSHWQILDLDVYSDLTKMGS
ncbi:MAG: hypothetical protein KA004_05585 [Verrucomicrobiales bacterium]|nr:hypothetical protein [Verrucomicrobiales bacterium]